MPYFFLVVFVLGLGGWTYWLKPYEFHWASERETGKLRQYLKDSGIFYENNPLEEFFMIGPKKIYILRQKRSQPVSVRAGGQQNAIGVVDGPIFPENGLAFAFEQPVERKGSRWTAWIVLDETGMLLDSAIYETDLTGYDEKILTDEKDFFASLKDQTRDHLFLTQDNGNIAVMKKGTALSRNILDTIRRGVDFYWDYRDIFTKRTEDARAAV